MGALVSGFGGAVAGWSIVSGMGMSAAGMVGGGADFGFAAGPVGAVVGGLVGLAAYSVLRSVKG
jgi:hypothetical protein